ncbi:MAG: PEP-CTERM sorting domain-containing protein [Verrucomicrobiota bacterium JB022]|nr:PEP-CTERM sorting domain-containing protein [Verrucomicrobiota bacterium JB022]
MRTLLPLITIGLITTAAHGLQITLDYTYDTNSFFSGDNAYRRIYLEEAAKVYERLLVDELSAIQPTAPNTYTQYIYNPGDGSTTTVVDRPVAANEVIIYAGGFDLGGTTLGRGGYGGWEGYGTQSFFETVNRGQGSVTGETADDFANWGGFMTFNTTAPWYFDDDVDTVEDFAGRFDFYSVAVHEFGHVFGLGTAASWKNLIDDNNLFQGENSIALYGSAVPVNSTGGHWANGVTSETLDGETQEVIMDPDIAANVRKYLTRLDIAGLDDLGWEIHPDYVVAVPEPRTYALLAGLSVLGIVSYRRRRL